jgi:hypothetical protein
MINWNADFIFQRHGSIETIDPVFLFKGHFFIAKFSKKQYLPAPFFLGTENPT